MLYLFIIMAILDKNHRRESEVFKIKMKGYHWHLLGVMTINENPKGECESWDDYQSLNPRGHQSEFSDEEKTMPGSKKKQWKQ